MTLLPLWTSLAGLSRPCLLRHVWHERLGAETVTTLERIGLLASAPRTGWLPCTGDCGGTERREVSPAPIGEDRWSVVCKAGLGCLPDEVSGEELEMLVADATGLATWLRRQLRTTGQPVRFERSGVHGLGLVPWDDELREGVLVAGLTATDLQLLLHDLAEAAPRSVVFVPTTRILPMSLRSAHGAWAPAMVVGLDDLLEVHGAQLRLRPRAGHLREPAALPYQAGPLVGHLFSADGERDLTLAAYNALVSQRASFDLFIDLMTPGTKRGVPVGVRDAKGQPRTVEIAARAIAALVELVQARKPIRVGQFDSVEVQSLDKIIENARRQIEGKGRRGNWRFFHTISGVEASAKSFVFRPQSGVTFAVIVPLPG